MPKMPPAVASEKCTPRPHGDQPTHEEPLTALPTERMGILEFHHQRTALPHTPSWEKHRQEVDSVRTQSTHTTLSSDLMLGPCSPPPQTRSSVKEAGLVPSGTLFPAAPRSPCTAKRLEFKSKFQGTRPACIHELQNLGHVACTRWASVSPSVASILSALLRRWRAHGDDLGVELRHPASPHNCALEPPRSGLATCAP